MQLQATSNAHDATASDLNAHIWADIATHSDEVKRYSDTHSKSLSASGCCEYFRFDNETSLLLFRGYERSQRSLSFVDKYGTTQVLGAAGCDVTIDNKSGQTKHLKPDHAAVMTSPADSEISIKVQTRPGAVFFIMPLPKSLFLGYQCELPYWCDAPLEATGHKSCFPQKKLATTVRLHKLSKDSVGTMHKLCNDSYIPLLRRQFVHGNCLQIVSETLQALIGKAQLGDTQDFEFRESLDITEKAEAILRQNYQSPPPLDEIARRVGTNRNKLSKSFRLIYGKTVFEYCQDYRMTLAKQLLGNRVFSIAQVAELIGYEHAGNFTCAYKRHFGELPKATRQHKKVSHAF